MVERKELYRLVWAEPMIKVAARFDVSGSYLKPYKKLLVDVTASKAALDKALEFANDLFNALEAAGHRVVIAPAGQALSRAEVDEREVPRKERNVYYHRGTWSPHRPTIVYVGTVSIGLAIVEMSEEVLLRYVGGKYVRDTDYVPPRASRHFVDRSWTTTNDLPSGRLRLVAYTNSSHRRRVRSRSKRMAAASSWPAASSAATRTSRPAGPPRSSASKCVTPDYCARKSPVTSASGGISASPDGATPRSSPAGAKTSPQPPGSPSPACANWISPGRSGDSEPQPSRTTNPL
ncbi:hypothetical protein [Lutibaculum baratangense]|uniref:hypothetical protein n=1 Tax=Lutibaculum baratangense TaxID=1358440 RepID=UPI000688A115|nr:hypothetical protein [Lutibaculum baratangense]